MTSATHIRCKISTLGLWKTLARPENGHIARKVRTLEINADVPIGMTEARIPDLIPTELALDNISFAAEEARDDGSALEREFIGALAQMTSLENFIWKRTPGPLITGEFGVWSTLSRLGAKSIRLVDNKLDDEGTPFALDVKEFFQLRNLTTLDLRTFALNDLDNEPDRGRFQSLQTLLIEHLPNIEHLNLDFCTNCSEINVSELLTQARWSRLKEITFLDAYCTPEALNAFLTAHPTIITLRLSAMMCGRRWAEIDLPEGALPNLLHLNCPSYDAARILARPSTRPLYLLTGVEVHANIKLKDYYYDYDGAEDEDAELDDAVIPSPWREEFLRNIKQHTGITHLALYEHDGGDEVELLSKTMPQLQWIDVGSVREGSIASPTISQWAHVLAEFKDIRTINMQPSIQKSLELFSLKCRNLQTFEDWNHVHTCRRKRENGCDQVAWEVCPRSRDSEVDTGGSQDKPYPSANFARVTLRRLGGPCVPGPIARAVFYVGRPLW
ncbi:hypothetical protein BJ138DRAFT_1166016 [Hygrophoropsis aurantiaca]|uniref:Uncharacterized protein n=1 Tax=Hygrophoropsis aurantiaca TaxID=72124 RepID=A0ACB7ZUK1_9AGAM|nr:hypothetical protein BJ138DRAFT_1166016 [Hygrophoropsis aurantiaca]